MRAIIQRVQKASVRVEDKIVGHIAHGLVILLGIEHEDDIQDAHYLIGKISQLRIFNDEQGKINLSINDVLGEYLVVSQFTLHASYKKGNRPSFIRAARPEKSEPLYAYFLEELKKSTAQKVAHGIFGADMKITLINDGPLTIFMDSKNIE